MRGLEGGATNTVGEEGALKPSADGRRKRDPEDQCAYRDVANGNQGRVIRSEHLREPGHAIVEFQSDV